MKNILKIALVSCLLTTNAMARTTCPEHYFGGHNPIANINNAIELCNRSYAVLWDPATRDPTYTAEHLTADSLQFAKAIPRINSFRPDLRLQPGDRATLADYRGSALYDRGHMAPDHDMPNAMAVHDSFLLSNMVPQVRANNRGPWAQVEETVRDLVVSVYQGEGWVVTGPAFVGEPKRLHGRVAVPSSLWKAVYVPGNAALHVAPVVGAWVLDNADEPNARFMSLDQLRAQVGVDPFPTLSPDLRAKAMLPDAAAKRTHVTVH